MFSSDEEEEEEEEAQDEVEQCGHETRADQEEEEAMSISSLSEHGRSLSENHSSESEHEHDEDQDDVDQEEQQEQEQDIDMDVEHIDEGEDEEDEEDEDEDEDGNRDSTRSDQTADEIQDKSNSSIASTNPRQSFSSSQPQSITATNRAQSPSTQALPPTSKSHLQSPSRSSNYNGTAQSPSQSVIDHSVTLDTITSPKAQPDSYKSHILQRYKSVTTPRTFLKPPLVDPLVFIPHGCPVHALAIPPCGSHLFSGGQDGFIRRISIYDSVTGSSVENLTMKQGGHVPVIEKETDKTTIFLTGYWENEDNYESLYNPSNRNDSSNSQTIKTLPIKWGPKSVGNATKVSPVYSLAIHKEELWGLSGTESGNINLFTIRHDEGHIRHVFKAAAPPSGGALNSSTNLKGHKPGSVISALDLNADQDFAFSGGWDGLVLGWDLNTGQVVDKFVAHASQISTVSLRHSGVPPIYDSKFEEMLLNPPRQEDNRVDRSEQPNEEVTGQVIGLTLPVKQSAQANSSAASSPDRPLASTDPIEEEQSEEDGSLFGGADNSASDIDSPMASVPPTTISPEPVNNSNATAQGGGLSLPGSSNQSKEKTAEKIEPMRLMLPSKSSDKPPEPPPKPILPPTNLAQVPSVLDASLPFLNDDILMTSGIDGQVYLWDRRISPSESKGLVRKLEVPKSTSPWTSSATWSIDGRSVFVGRRNNSVDIYDLRFIRTSQFHSCVQRTIKLPSSSGPVSCVQAWPDGHNLLCASFDNLRLYNLDFDLFDYPLNLDRKLNNRNHPGKIPFKIIPGHSSGVVSQMCVTPSFRYLITASGDRGWENISNELVVIHEIRATT